MVQYGATSIFLVPLVHALWLSKKKKKKKEKKKKKTKRGKCRECSLHVGAPLLGSKVSYVRCSVPTASWEAWFVGFGPIQE